MTVGASANGVGVSFEGDAKVACSTYSLFSATVPPLPLLRDACAIGFSNFSLTTSAAAIRKQASNTVNTTDASGSVMVAVSLDQPFALNALASANLLFNDAASIQPSVTLELATSLQVSGDFQVRSYKISDDVLRIGLYKKHGSTLTVSFTAVAGVGGDIGNDDVLGALLNAALPGVDSAKAGITGDNAIALNNVIKDGIDFLCTATYAAIGGKLNLKLSVVQSYLDYKGKMSWDEMHENILLGYALNLIPLGSLDAMLKATPSFYHACCSGTVHYDTPALLNIFYKDPASQTQRSRVALEQVGRNVMCALLDPSDDTDAVRLSILKNDNAWTQMNSIGNTAVFSNILYLSHLSATELSAVSSDWISIVWWAEALSKIAPALSSAIVALSKASAENPTQDPGFVKARTKLANVLGAVTRNTDAAFVHGWGAAVMFALSGKHGSAEMNLTWNSKNLHFGPPVSR